MQLQNHLRGFTGNPWPRARFDRLCRIIKCHPAEILAKYFIPEKVMEKWLKADSIPPYVSLHFELLERELFHVGAQVKL